MGYIIAFFIFLVVVNIIGILFSFLWPVIVVLILLALLGNILAYRKRKKVYKEFYEDTFASQSYQEDTRSSHDDNIIDVEFSEQEVDDQE